MADAAPLSKEEKAKQKKEEKAKREAEKEANRKAREDAQQAKAQKALGASVTLENYDGHAFGNMFIQSHAIADTSPRTWTEVEQLGTALKGKEVWVRGRAAAVRVKGKLCFITLRSSIYSVQVVCSDTDVKDISSFAGSITKESVIDIYGEVTVPEQTTTCTQKDVELAVKRLFVISRAAGELPLQLEDAARPDDAPTEEGRAVVSQDTRLNNRVIDLRTAANQGIFRMQHGVCMLFRGFLLSQARPPPRSSAHPRTLHQPACPPACLPACTVPARGTADEDQLHARRMIHMDLIPQTTIHSKDRGGASSGPSVPSTAAAAAASATPRAAHPHPSTPLSTPPSPLPRRASRRSTRRS